MTDNELEEFRYDIAHALLSKMSKGSQFQYALDRMIQLIALYEYEDLMEIAPAELWAEKKKKPKDRPKRGKGF